MGVAAQRMHTGHRIRADRRGAAAAPGRTSGDRGQAVRNYAPDGGSPRCGPWRRPGAGARKNRSPGGGDDARPISWELRRPGGLRDHRRPGAGDDVPVAVPARAARAARRARSSASPSTTGRSTSSSSARASRSSAPARSSTRRSSSGFAARLSYVQGDFADAATYARVGEAIEGAASARLLPRDPAVPLRDGRQGARRGRADGLRPGRRREAVRPRPRLGAGARRGAAPATSTSRSSTGSTTTSGRWGSRRSSTCASRTRCSSRSGTGTTSSACRSRWPRTSASRTAATSTTPSARCATSSSTTSCRSSAPPRWSRPPAATPRPSRTRCSAVFRAMPGGRPGALRARPVRRLPRHRRRRGRLDDGDVRGAAPRDRQLALVGRAVLHPHRQAPAGDPDRGPAVFKHPPRLGFAVLERRPEPNQLVIKLDPSTGVRMVLDARRADAAAAAPIPLDMEFAQMGGEGADAVRGAAARGDDRREHALHPPGRRRGDVADHAAAARRAAARARLRAGHVGPRGRGRARRPTYGGWHDPWVAS